MAGARAASKRAFAAVVLLLLVMAAVAGGFALREASRDVVTQGTDQREGALRRLELDRAARDRRARAEKRVEDRNRRRRAAEAQRGATTEGNIRRRTLRRGSGYESRAGSNQVRRLQRALRRLGLVPRLVASPSGQLVLLTGTGQFGPATERGVRRFQRRERLPVTGIADAETLDRIYAAARRQGRKR